VKVGDLCRWLLLGGKGPDDLDVRRGPSLDRHVLTWPTLIVLGPTTARERIPPGLNVDGEVPRLGDLHPFNRLRARHVDQPSGGMETARGWPTLEAKLTGDGAVGNGDGAGQGGVPTLRSDRARVGTGGGEGHRDLGAAGAVASGLRGEDDAA